MPYEWSRPAYTAFEVILMEFGDFPMMRRMLLGIKQRAEGHVPGSRAKAAGAPAAWAHAERGGSNEESNAR